MKKCCCILFFFSSLLIFQISECKYCYSQPTIDWVRIYPDTFNIVSGVEAITSDDSGNVYVTGLTSNNQNSLSGFCTIKYSPSGFQQWVSYYYGTNDGGRIPNAIILDKFSNVYVTGYSYEPGHFVDYCTVKYNSNGVQQWVTKFDGSVHGQDQAEQIAIDNAGNVYVSGFSQIAVGFALVTIKYSPDGRMLWSRSYGNGISVAYINGIKTDGNCNVYVAGDYDGALTLKYDSTGLFQWIQIYGAGTAGINSLCVDTNNNIYVAGFYNISGDKNDFLTIKYSSSGIQQWARRYSIDTSGPASMNVANSIETDANGNAFVSGVCQQSPQIHRNLLTLKYSNEGDLFWAQKDSNSLAGIQSSMKIDNNNNIYLEAAFSIPFPSSFGIVKYNSSGILQWSDNSFASGNPSCIVLDNSLNLIVGGISMNNMCTVKYSQQPNGIQFPESEIPKYLFLNQNYPNPFNLVTTIKFNIPLTCFVKLEVFDLLGRDVGLIYSGIMNAGIHKFNWDGSNFPSGVYFYRLETAYNEQVKKMILLK